MKASTVNLYKVSKEVIDQTVRDSAVKDRLLTIKQANDRAAREKDGYTQSKMCRKIHALSMIDDHLFQQLINNGL